MNRQDEEALKKRFGELAARAWQSGRAVYTDFLDAAEQDLLLRLPGAALACPYSLFGGTAGAERRIACFAAAPVAEADFPICCLQIAPLQPRFAEELGHRDLLGSLLHLGLERRMLGDIIVRPQAGYLFCLERIAPVLCQDLTRVKHTAVRCQPAEQLPEGALFCLQPMLLLTASQRLDAVLAQAYRLSRSESQAAVAAGRAFVNSRLCENSGYLLREGDLVSLRGCGRFRFLGVEQVSRKGKLRFRIEKYV